LRGLRGERFGGAREIPFSEALVLTAPGVRPSFRPITRVGVLPLARVRSCLTCTGVQGLPVFRVDFEMLRLQPEIELDEMLFVIANFIGSPLIVSESRNRVRDREI
jgi:hypothetical protein